MGGATICCRVNIEAVMAGLGRKLLAWGTFGAVMLGGWALMTYTVPTKEQMLKVATTLIDLFALQDHLLFQMVHIEFVYTHVSGLYRAEATRGSV